MAWALVVCSLQGLNIISKYFKRRRSMATGIVTCGQGGGVLILGPLLQTMVDAFGWQTTYRIMAGVVLFLCLSGLTYSPDVQIEGAENASVEMKSKGCHIDVSVWREPKFVAVVVSASVMMFGHYVPQIHLVNTHIYENGAKELDPNHPYFILISLNV